MLNRLFSSFRSLTVVFALIILVSNVTYAAVKLSNNEKDVFKLSYSLGEASYLLPDMTSNEGIMGLAVLQSKLVYLQSQASQQNSYIQTLGFSKNTIDLSKKFQKELQGSLVRSEFNRKNFQQAQKTYMLYSSAVREDVTNSFGQKLTWLFEAGFLAGFTNVSMQSEYQNKLVLLQFRHLLEYVPYDLPSSILGALSNIATQKDANLSSSEIELLKESAQNINLFFTNPESYSPPATIKSLVGVWEGRLAEPGGSYHKATFKIYPDLTGELSAENLFDGMPAKDISITQTAVNFYIKPFNDEKLMIRFSGRLVDDMMAGDAVDISGKNGKWQFLKTSKQENTALNNVEVVTNASSLNKMVGVWKGKILEESGAISNSTLYFNLVNDSKLVVDNGSSVKELTIKDIAVNDQAIKFIVNPDDGETLNISFLGKVKGLVIEGNALANDGSRGYWKLVKQGEDKIEPKIEPKSKVKPIKKSYLDYSELCDPIINKGRFDNITFVLNEIAPVASFKLKNGEYKGYLVFGDGYKADLAMLMSDNGAKFTLASQDNNSLIELIPQDLSITDREITFKTYLDENKESEVVFKGKIFGDYIAGTAKNAAGDALDWELIAVNKAKEIIDNKKPSDITKLYGLWSGGANVESFMRQPVSLNFSKDSNTIKIAQNDPVEITNIALDADKVGFILPANKYSDAVFVFNGSLDQGRLTGVFTSTSGLGFDIDLNLEKPLVKNEISGIWIGELNSGNAIADIIFDFTSGEKKIYVDDSKADSGRAELLISDFNITGNKVKFKAKTKKSPSVVVFEGNILNKNIKGLAFNNVQTAKKLTWSVNMSSLTEYLPDKIKEEISKKPNIDSKNETFSFLDQLEDKSDKSPEVKTVPDSEVIKDNVVVKVKVDEPEAEQKPVSITDEDKYNKVDIEKANKKLNKPDEKLEKSGKKVVKSDQIDKITQQESKIEKVETVKPVVEEVKKPESSTKTVEPEEKTEAQKQDTDKKVETAKPIVEEAKKSGPSSITVEPKDVIKEQKQDVSVKGEEVKIDPKEFNGKWIGELDNPEKGKGEIILEIKPSESYMYVDKYGEKIPFKLFDFNIDNKQISFMIKPSDESEFGIKFKGSLIQGVMSGDATDPTGSKGKWFAKKP